MINRDVSTTHAETKIPTVAMASGVVDWRVLADARLTRLVELEHDCSVMRERMSALQIEYRELLVTSDSQLQQIWELDRTKVKLNRRLAELERAHADMRASFLGSRSWRLTRPLRSLSTSVSAGRRGVGNLLRAMLRVPWLRRIAGLMAHMVPGLHRRLRSRLYPRA